MAAFYKYICRFDNCQKIFNSLVDLIDHIEYIHIVRDPIVLKKQELAQPAAVALSYVNCFFSEHLRDDRPDDIEQDVKIIKDVKLTDTPKKSHLKTEILNDSFDSSVDDTDAFSEAGSDDSCMSWSTSGTASIGNSIQHEQSTTPLPNVTAANPSPVTSAPNITAESLQGKFTCLEDSEGKKRFLCTVPGCEKKYKNINGIKYHVKNGHNKKDGQNNEIRKRYTCHCGKAYKSQSGLRHHQTTQHGAGASTSNSSSVATPTTSTPSTPASSKMNPQVSNTYSPVTYDVRMDNNFKQPQLKHPQQVQTLPPVAEMYQPHTPLSPSSIVS